MATLFDWCCRRIRRGRSCSPDGSEDGKESPAAGGEQSGGAKGKKGGRSSRFSKSASSDAPAKKKKKGEKKRGKTPGEKQEGDGVVADLSVVKREHEVLRPYQKPPPPRNRARASRAPRGLKAQNSNANHAVLQEVDETDLPKEDAPSTSVVDDSSSPTHLPNTDEGSKPSSPASSSDPSDKPGKTPAETDEDSTPAIAEDSQDDLKEIKEVSKEDAAAPKSPADQEEELVETVAVEPAAQPVTEEANSSSETPLQTEDVTSDSENGAHVDESLKPETKSEKEDSGNEQTKDEDSEKEQTKDDVSSDKSDGDDGGSGGGDGGDGEGDDSVGTVDGEGAGVSPNKGTSEDLEQPDAVGTPTEPNASCANGVAAEEDGIQKVSLRSASSSKSPSSAAKQTTGKGKRFPVPSVHGEGMDQLMESLQIRLKEDGISLENKVSDKEGPKATKHETPERARPLSDIVQRKDRQVDIADEETETALSPSEGDQPEDGKMDIVDKTPDSQD